MHPGSKKPITSVIEIVFDPMDHPVNVSAIGRGGLLGDSMSGLDIACRQQKQAVSIWYGGSRKPTESSEIGRTKKFDQLAVTGRFRNGGPR